MVFRNELKPDAAMGIAELKRGVLLSFCVALSGYLCLKGAYLPFFYMENR
jgi:hypothetical protein